MNIKRMIIVCILLFILMWKFSCGDLNQFLIESVSQHANIMSLSINFILENITATDVRVMAPKLFFEHNSSHFENQWRDVPVTFYNMDRTSWMQQKYPLLAVIILYVDKYLQESINSLKLFWREARKNKIILVTNECEPIGSIVEISAFFWSLEMLNFLILNSCNDITNSYTYFPFGNNQCKLFNETNIIKIGSLHKNTLMKSLIFISEYEHNSKEFTTNALSAFPFFPNKIPLDLKHCPLKISTCIWPPSVIDVSSVDEAGTEVEFIRIIEKHINCNVSFVTVSVEEVGLRFGENEESVGQLAMLKEEIYDLIFGAVPLHLNTFKEFETTECFQRNVLTFIVPKARVRPSSTILWILFEKHSILFLVILGNVVILSIMINGMVKLTSKSHHTTKSNPHNIVNISATLLRSLIETSKPIIPENKIIQWVYGTWFASSLIISSYFNTTLITYFTEPGYFEQIKTLNDIIDSKIPISINEMYLEEELERLTFKCDYCFRYYSIMPMIPEYAATYIAIKNVRAPVPMGLKLASMGQAATVTDLLRAQHLSVQWVSNNGESSIYYLRNDIEIRFWNIMVMYKGNPLMERIAEIMRKINQSGFWDFQIARYYNRRLIRTMIRQHLIVYNYEHNINNTLLIHQFNEGYIDSLRILGGNAEIEKLLLETNEEDIISRFMRDNKTLVTWDHLAAAFRMWYFGMGTGFFIFLIELFSFKYFKFTNVKHFIFEQCHVR